MTAPTALSLTDQLRSRSPSSWLPRLPVRSQQAAAVAAGCLLTWWLAQDVLAGGVLPLALVLGACAGVLLLLRPREGALCWLVVCATILPARVLPVSAVGVRTDLAEALGLALVGAVAFRGLLSLRGRTTPFTGPLVLLVASAVSGAIVASLDGAARATWLGPLKSLLLYLVPLAFLSLFADRAQRDRLERWIHGLCTVGGLLVLFSAVSGRDVPAGEVPEVVTLGVSSEALRLRPALLTLTVLATLLLVARVSSHGLRVADVGRFAVYASVVALSFTRSTWVPLTLALLLLTVLRPGRRVPLRGIKAAMALTVVCATTFALADSGALGGTPEAIALRIQSIGSDRVLEENSYRDREIESTLAREAIARSPVTGVGLGQPYGAVRRVIDPLTQARSYQPRLFIHNSVLGFWLWGGLLAIVALVWLGVRVATTAARAARRLPEAEGARAVAAGLAVLALGLQSTFQTSLSSRSVIATLGCALVFLYAARPDEDAA